MAESAEQLLSARLGRVMGDARFEDGRPMGGPLRFYVIAVHWATYQERDSTAMYEDARRILGWTQPDDVHRIPALIAADAPRYEPASVWRKPRCAELLVSGPRAGQPCGGAVARSFRVHRDDGEWDLVGWCARHRGACNAARRREEGRTGWPEPRPNVGGLLPAHIAAENWAEVYAAAKPGWKAPVGGINADGWPWALSAGAEPAKPELRLVLGDGAAGGGPPDPPPLRLIE